MTLGHILKYFAELKPSTQITTGVETLVPHVEDMAPTITEAKNINLGSRDHSN